MTVTWNPADKHVNLHLSNDDLTASASGKTDKVVRATEFKNSGKWYWEITCDQIYWGFSYDSIGIADDSHLLTLALGDDLDAESHGYLSYGYKWHQKGKWAYGGSYGSPAIIGIALDLDTGKIWWSYQGSWQAGGDPEAGTGEAFSGIAGNVYPAISLNTPDSEAFSRMTANFGSTAFKYDVPSGFEAINVPGGSAPSEGTVWNPLDKHADMVLSNGDLTAELPSCAISAAVRSVAGVDTGKHYWEITLDNQPSQMSFGVATEDGALDATVGGDEYGWGWYDTDPTGKKYHDGSSTTYGEDFDTGDVVSIALDLDAGKIWWALNGVWQDDGDPGAGTDEAFSGLSGYLYAIISIYAAGQITVNFGASAFAYSVPSGFQAGLFAAYTDMEVPALEVVSYGNFGAHRDDITLPAPRITFMAGYGHDGIPWPMLVLTSESIPGLVGIAEVDLPGLSASGRSGVLTRFDLPVLTIEAIGGIGTEVRFDLPVLTIEAVGGGQSRFELPGLTLEATGTVGEVGTASLAFPVLSINATGTVQIFGNADLDLFALGFVSTGHPGRIGSLRLDLPKVSIFADGALFPSGDLYVDLALSVLGSGENPYRFWNYILEHER